MADSPPHPVPERTSSLEEGRSVTVRQISVHSSVSEFLEAKIAALEESQSSDLETRRAISHGKAKGYLTDEAFEEESRTLLIRFKKNDDVIRILKRQQRKFSEDLEEVVAAKRRRLHAPDDLALYEDAYVESIIPRVMASSAKQSGHRFNQSRFKKAVNEYYGAPSTSDLEASHCHVTGFAFPSAIVKAAHIVPKSLSEEELTHLFGSEHDVASDPRNSLLLLSSVEKLLDVGTIAIVPVVGEFTIPTTWRCAVLDESRNMDTVYQFLDKTFIRVKDLDGKVLTFLNDNRPRRRYLFFRFVISYLNAKRKRLEFATNKIETRRFWPSGGEYIHKSTLNTLARCVSGHELPDHVVAENTFETSLNPSRDEAAGMIAASDFVQSTSKGKGKAVDSHDPREALFEGLNEMCLQ